MTSEAPPETRGKTTRRVLRLASRQYLLPALRAGVTS
jgi:hypothetical protein